jgi:hypothetical protein
VQALQALGCVQALQQLDGAHLNVPYLSHQAMLQLGRCVFYTCQMSHFLFGLFFFFLNDESLLIYGTNSRPQDL